ncbi:aminotransferase class III-fold pyridoxal phosphate-dependent enzyme [Leekyejoonella antrihumi]|uniref:Aminotransferase class III-fold pyridoxal phosphate-dependent enzyme n=1 Tax=Leekyejoonella antrihumi TaxID=1660198 RepID=A0A563E2T8_9MICO|nr:aminotransferase class III-fold pyridoxal phosphate-dependent enzyme [Leekyejoonella antrihumi]TWP36619.1 aminotransferase class III-fold pyridoxal phosphate-dependent enzyme [Leekyejoonella antrihumi]
MVRLDQGSLPVCAAISWPQVNTVLPGPRSSELLARKDRVLQGPLRDGENVPFVLGQKHGHVIEDVDGNTFADHVSAWGAAPYGAQPPLVREAVNTAWDRYGMEISQYLSSEPVLSLAERLVEIAPGQITRVAPTVTGTEAVEGSVKLAREVTGRPIILGFLGQYHGESTYLTAAASTDLPSNTRGFAQYVPGVVLVPYPQSFRAPFHRGPGPYDDTLYLEYIREWVLRYQVEPDQVAGVLIEPVAGEAGILSPSQAFWDGLTAMCQEYDWKLILDEVQTGLGRCGTVFAAERWGLEPDLLLVGKGVTGGGQAVAGVLGTEEMMAGSAAHLGGTYAWEPAACAGALAGLDLLADGSVLSNVMALESIAREELGPLVGEVGQVGDVRWVGAWACLEFVTVADATEPAPEFQHAVHLAAMRRGVFAISEESKPLYRMQPALTMEPELFRWSCRQVADAIREVAEDMTTSHGSGQSHSVDQRRAPRIG